MCELGVSQSQTRKTGTRCRCLSSNDIDNPTHSRRFLSKISRQSVVCWFLSLQRTSKFRPAESAGTEVPSQHLFYKGGSEPLQDLISRFQGMRPAVATPGEQGLRIGFLTPPAPNTATDFGHQQGVFRGFRPQTRLTTQAHRYSGRRHHPSPEPFRPGCTC